MVVRGTFILPKEASDGGGPMALLMSEIIQKKKCLQKPRFSVHHTIQPKRNNFALRRKEPSIPGSYLLSYHSCANANKLITFQHK